MAGRVFEGGVGRIVGGVDGEVAGVGVGGEAGGVVEK